MTEIVTYPDGIKLHIQDIPALNDFEPFAPEVRQEATDAFNRWWIDAIIDAKPTAPLKVEWIPNRK